MTAHLILTIRATGSIPASCAAKGYRPERHSPFQGEGRQLRRIWQKQVKRISGLQERLYAENKQSLLIVLQAMDTGGKDGTIRGVFDSVNPEGCQVWSFKAPTPEELAHDFLWRIHEKTPERGMINIFNRSHYEDVLVVRVHELVPQECLGEAIRPDQQL